MALDAAQLHTTVHGPADAATWSPEERVLLATVDALLDERRLGDDAWAALKAHFSDEQAFEIVQLVAFYHGVALICGAFDLPLETQAARFPAA